MLVFFAVSSLCATATTLIKRHQGCVRRALIVALHQSVLLVTPLISRDVSAPVLAVLDDEHSVQLSPSVPVHFS